MKIKRIFIGRRPARETPRNQGGGRAKRHSCQELNDDDEGKMWRPLKFGGLGVSPQDPDVQQKIFPWSDWPASFDVLAWLEIPCLLEDVPEFMTKNLAVSGTDILLTENVDFGNVEEQGQMV